MYGNYVFLEDIHLSNICKLPMHSQLFPRKQVAQKTRHHFDTLEADLLLAVSSRTTVPSKTRVNEYFSHYVAHGI